MIAVATAVKRTIRPPLPFGTLCLKPCDVVGTNDILQGFPEISFVPQHGFLTARECQPLIVIGSATPPGPVSRMAGSGSRGVHRELAAAALGFAAFCVRYGLIDGSILTRPMSVCMS